MSPENKQETKPEKQSSDFKYELDSILNNPLTPENIDHYADSALDKIINLTDRILRGYKSQTGDTTNNAEIENAAYEHYQLGDINSLLDYISEKDKEIKDLNNIIANAEIVDDVITPPEVIAAMNIIGGTESFEKPTTIPRLKTLIFILENEFDIDPKNQGQFRLTKGMLRDTMMRRESYYCVETPTINRTTLVCDEEGNATFVFDDEKLKDDNISNQDLLSLTKEDIKGLVEQGPDLGQRIIYSKYFTARIICSLRGWQKTDNEQELNDDESFDRRNEYVISYLVPKTPEDFESVTSLAKKLGMKGSGIVYKIIEELGDSIGPVEQYRFGARTVPGYSPEQQAIIVESLSKRGIINATPPVGFESAKSLNEKLGISQGVVSRAIDALGDNICTAKKYKFKSMFVPGYSSEQQEAIIDYLTERGLFNLEAPEGFESISSLTKKIGLSYDTVIHVVNGLGDEIGPIQKYRVGPSVALCYSPDQQKVIINHLSERGLFSLAPLDGYESMSGICEKVGTTADMVYRAIKEIGNDFGPVEKYKFKTKTVSGYSPEQQIAIIKHLTEQGVLGHDAPDGYESINGLVKKINLGASVINRALKDIGDSIGVIDRYKFNTYVTYGFSPEQQNAIIDYLKSSGSFSHQSPEGYDSVFGIALRSGFSYKAVGSAIKNIGDAIGPTERFKFGSRSRVTLGYSPEQQEKIIERIRINKLG